MGSDVGAQAAHRVVTTAGHVDHGKSTLLRVLTGQEPDRLAEEKRRGLTIELGYVWGTFGSQTVAFVDVPGHERFIGTMLAGTGASPAALFVVAADDGWSKQSEEHRDILALLNIPCVAIAITKTDTVSQQRVTEIQKVVVNEMAGTSLANSPVVVTDALSGRGIDELRDLIDMRLSAMSLPPSLNRPRLFVDRAFAVAGAGAVVTGTLVDGSFHVDDEVRVLPDGTASRIRSMQSLGVLVTAAGPGSRVALNLAGVSHQSLNRGDTVVGTQHWPSTTDCEAVLTVLDGQSVTNRGAWELHVGSTSTPAAVQLIGEADGAAVAVRLKLARALTLRSGDRFVLRETGRRRVVAGGVVTDPVSQPLARGKAAKQARQQACFFLTEADAKSRLLRLAALSGGVCDTKDLLARAGWDPQRPLPDGLLTYGDATITGTRFDEAGAALATLGEGVHSRETAEAAFRAAGFDGGQGKALLGLAVEHKLLVRVPGGFVLPGFLDDAERVRLRRVALLLGELNAKPFAPPPVDDVAHEVGLNHRDVAALASSGLIVKVGDLTFSRDAVDAAKAALVTLAKTTPTFTASDARQVWDTSRKFAIPLLEYFDRTGVTRFDGQMRTLV